jgi:hypothetical protein
VRVAFEARREVHSLDRLSLLFEGEASIETILAAEPDAVRLPIDDRSRWTVAADAGTDARLTHGPDVPWRLDVKHEARGDHWAYPSFRLPDDVTLNETDTLVVRARCERAGTVRLFLWEGEGGVGYLTPGAVVADDGAWHVARVRVRDLDLSAANAADPDGKLDVGSVRRLSFGLNSEADANAVELSDLILIRGREGP